MKTAAAIIAGILIGGLAMLAVTAKAATVLPIFQGGTGNNNFISGLIPFGDGTNPLATSTNLNWNNTASRLTATYASSTAISAPTVCIGSDCKTSFPTSLSTLSTSFPLSFSNPTLSYIGLASSTNLSQGQVLYATGVNTFGMVATTSPTCSGLISCPNLVTFTNAAGATTFTASYDAWTHPVAGYSATTSAIGVGTSTAWAYIGVNPTAGIASRSFVVGSSSATLFDIENDGRVGIGTSTIGTGLMGQFNVEAGAKATAAYLTGSNNGFLQLNVQNRSAGGSASSDIVATSDNGSDTTHYIDVGINGSTGSAVPFTTANHAYLYSVDDTLNIGALGSAAQLIFYTTGGVSNPSERLRITSVGTVGIGTSTPQHGLDIASSTGPQLGLLDGSLTSDQWVFRSIGNNLYIASSSPSTFSTSTLSSSSNILTLLGGSTANTSGNIGIGTSTPIATLSIGATGGATPLSVGSTSGKTIFRIGSAQHIFAKSGTPVISSCGTSPSLQSGSTDTGGTIFVGTGGVTACTLTFASPFSSDGLDSMCTAMFNGLGSGTTTVLGASSTPSAIIFRSTSSFGGGRIGYLCLGR